MSDETYYTNITYAEWLNKMICKLAVSDYIPTVAVTKDGETIETKLTSVVAKGGKIFFVFRAMNTKIVANGIAIDFAGEVLHMSVEQDWQSEECKRIHDAVYAQFCEH